MTPLPKTIRRDQFDFLQVMANHPVYIYQKRKGRYEGYEVVIARKHGPAVINGRHISPGWSYPSSEHWGTYGWTCQTMERARQKAFELVDSMEKAKA